MSTTGRRPSQSAPISPSSPAEQASSHPMEGWSAYCASKAGLAMLTQSVALERPDLRVYGFRPGVVDTDMQGVIRASGINRISKLRREDLLRPRVPASGVAWLVQNAPADLSGQEVDIRDESFKARMAGSVAPTV